MAASVTVRAVLLCSHQKFSKSSLVLTGLVSFVSLSHLAAIMPYTKDCVVVTENRFW